MPLALLGIDVGDIVGDAIRALVDLLVPDFGAGWVSRLVTWLVALPPVTGGAFPSLRGYARDLTAVGYGLLGACLVGGLLQLWAAGFAGGPQRSGEALRRGAVAAIALAAYPTVLGALLVVVNVLTAAMIRHPLVIDGLDKAFGEAFAVAAVTGGLSLGLAIGAAVALLYFVAALVVFKVGLTALLAVLALSGALVWGLYPLPQASWLPRAWLAGLVAALVLPIAWACVFAAAALLARDTLVFDGGSRFNQPLGDALAYLVKPLATVACFWLAYKAPQYLVSLARSAGLTGSVLAGSPLQPVSAGGGRASRAGGRYEPTRLAARAVALNRDRFRALATRARAPLAASAGSVGNAATRTAAPGANRRGARVLAGAVGRAAGSLSRANAAWRALPAEGGRRRKKASGARSSSRGPRTAPAAWAARPQTRAPSPTPSRAPTQSVDGTPARQAGPERRPTRTNSSGDKPNARAQNSSPGPQRTEPAPGRKTAKPSHVTRAPRPSGRLAQAGNAQARPPGVTPTAPRGAAPHTKLNRPATSTPPAGAARPPRAPRSNPPPEAPRKRKSRRAAPQPPQVSRPASSDGGPAVRRPRP